MKIGQLCYKIAGREAKKLCVITDTLDSNYVMIDGQVKKRRCSIKHLELLNRFIDIKKDDPKEKIISLLEKDGIKVKLTKPKIKKPKPVKQRPEEAKNERRTTKEVSRASVSEPTK